jgi:hypothetical protein
MADGTLLQYSANSGNSNFYLYKSHSNTPVPPPDPGFVYYNNAVQSLATTIYVSHLTDDNIDIEVFFANLSQLNEVYIQQKTLSENFIKYNITGPPTITPGSNVSIPVSSASFSGTGQTSFGVNEPIVLSFFTNTIETDTRITSLETKTQNQSAVLNTTTFTNKIETTTVQADTFTSTTNNAYILFQPGGILAHPVLTIKSTDPSKAIEILDNSISSLNNTSIIMDSLNTININGNLHPSSASTFNIGTSALPYLSGEITTLASTTSSIRNGATNTTLLTTAASSAGVVMKLPATIGSAGQVLSTDGSGNSSWITSSGSVLTTKGDIYVAGVGGVVSRLPVGIDGQFLVADSTTTLGVKWATLSSYVRLIAFNIPASSQATLQAYYDGVGGNIAPDTVPTDVTTADTGNTGGAYSVYLGHNSWWYRQDSTGVWVTFGSGGKSAFGSAIAKLYTYR